LKLFKILTSVLIASLVLIAVGCSASQTAERRLERNGYRLESGNEEDVSNELNEWGIENVNNIYLVYEDDPDDDIPNAVLVEFESQSALEDDIVGEDEDIEDYEDYIFRNIFVISLEITNVDQIIDIIKGDN